MLILFIILIVVVVVVVVVVNDDTYYWVYWSSDHQFQVYYKVRQLLLQGATAHLLQSVLVCYYKVRQLFYYKERQVLLQSATILLPSVIGITKCDRTVYRERYRPSYWLKRAGSWRNDFFYCGMPVRRLFEDDLMR